MVSIQCAAAMATRGQERTGVSSRSQSGVYERTPTAYKICDHITECILYFSIVFAPWAFGTTNAPEIWILDAAGYLLGALLVTKWILRWRLGYAPARWLDPHPGTHAAAAQKATWLLAFLTVVILLYCVLGALNARALVDSSTGRFVYNPHTILWLPHSYDYPATWQYAAHYLAFACTFWAVRDWLLGRTSRERRFVLTDPAGAVSQSVRESIKASSEGSSRVPGELPDRLRRLLWVICINSSLLALESILQRLSGTGKLLWLLEPIWNKTEESQFGPYAYRSNAAQYLNLAWPLCLGFWSMLLRENRLRVGLRSRVGGSAHVILLPCAVLLMAAPMISTSRGGALIAVAGILTAVGILLAANLRSSRWVRIGIMVWFLAVIGLVGFLGWERLQKRLYQMFEDDSMSGRTEIYENSRRILADHQVFGVGPGAFAAVYKFYRKPGQTWEAWVHDDWLEFAITFGFVGFSFLVLVVLLIASRWFGSDGIHVPWEFMALCYVSLAGCLLHAKFDFPFQVHSIVHLFAVTSVIVFCIRRQGAP